jgi:hypothetical protein
MQINTSTKLHELDTFQQFMLPGYMPVLGEDDSPLGNSAWTVSTPRGWTSNRRVVADLLRAIGGGTSANWRGGASINNTGSGLAEFSSAARALAVVSIHQGIERRWLRKRHNRFEGQRIAVGVVPIRHATDGVPENLNRRFRHVLVVVGGASFSKILQDPEFLLAGFHVLLRLDTRQITQ